MKIKKLNKKAEIFMPLLSIITLIAVITLAYYITTDKIQRQKDNVIVGGQALSIINLRKEITNSEFYVQKSSQFAIQDSLNVLGENAGYPKENTCKKSLTDSGYIIMADSCGIFNPEESFKKQFEKSLNFYLSQYLSVYPLKYTLYDNTGNNLPSEESLNARTVSTANIRALTIKLLVLNKDSTLLEFLPKKYSVEYSTIDSFYQHLINLILQPVSFKEYDDLYNALLNCKTTFEQCEVSIKAKFPDATIIKSADLYKITTNTIPNIKLLFDPKQSLPAKITSK